MQYSFLLKCIFIHMAINYSQIVLRGKKFNFFVSPRTIIVYFFLRNFHIWQEFIAATRDIHRLLQTIQMKLILLCVWALVTQPMLQRRPNRTELRSMDYCHQIFCRFRKWWKVPPPLLLSNDFEKSWVFSLFF